LLSPILSFGNDNSEDRINRWLRLLGSPVSGVIGFGIDILKLGLYFNRFLI